ncbi:MAG: metallophosphoesterase family protein [Candidatus Aenigmatarchaeota archaeon]
MVRMRGTDNQFGLYPEEDKKPVAVISDTHYERRSPPAVEEEIKQIENYGDIYGCEELWAAGDIGSISDVEKLIDSDFETIRLVPGNHDHWDEITLKKNSLLLDDIHCHEKLDWELEIGSDNYKICMSHRPHDFGTRVSYEEGMDCDYSNYDILVHGHSHMSHFRPLEEKVVALGCGSTHKNFYMPSRFPRRSMQVLEINSAIDIKEIDIERDEVVLEKLFKKTKDGGFEESVEWRQGHYDKLFGENVTRQDSQVPEYQDLSAVNLL